MTNPPDFDKTGASHNEDEGERKINENVICEEWYCNNKRKANATFAVNS